MSDTTFQDQVIAQLKRIADALEDIRDNGIVIDNRDDTALAITTRRDDAVEVSGRVVTGGR